MKVCVISSSAPSLMTFRIDMMRAFIKQGHQVMAIAPEPGCDWAAPFLAEGIQYHSIPISRNGLNPIQDLLTLSRLTRKLKREQPDVVFAYQAKSIVYGCIASKLSGINSIYAMVAGLGSIFRSGGKPNMKSSLLKFILTLQYRIALSCCQRVFFQNQDDIDVFASQSIVRPTQPCLVNGSGVNLSDFKAQPIPASPVFLFVGRLIRDKGLMEYMEAARLVKRKHPKARFQLVGPFDTNPTALSPKDLEPYIEDGSIEYQGEAQDVRPNLTACSVFVLPSYHEGTPKSILEAMATGRPILTTDAPGCRETVVHGHNGYLVPVQDVQALAERMEELIENHDDLSVMADASLRICKEKYDVNKVNHILLKTMQLNQVEVAPMLEEIKDRKQAIAVVGLGYVGLPLAVAFSKQAKVIGYDSNDKKIAKYQEGIDPTNEVGHEAIKNCTVQFTSNPERITEASFIVVAVPTPVDRHNKPDLGAIQGASQIVGRHLRQGAIVVYESTVYPGVTEEICVPILEKESGLTYGIDFKVGYSPERINPGDKVHRLESIIKIVAGSDQESLDTIAAVYELIIEAGVYRASSIKVAEAAKVIENAQRDINIAFVNELSIIFNRLGIDTLDVLKTAGTKWNFLNFRPGLVGGHCIGVDPYYLTYKAEEIGYHPEVIQAGRRINDSMGKYVAESVVKQLIRNNCPVKGANVLIMGVTFKENVPDVRNSKVIDIIRELQDYEVNVFAVDPYADQEEIEHEYGIHLETEIPLVDAIVVAVNHQEFVNMNLDRLREHYAAGRSVLIDVKGVFDRTEAEAGGFKYWRL